MNNGSCTIIRMVFFQQNQMMNDDVIHDADERNLGVISGV